MVLSKTWPWMGIPKCEDNNNLEYRCFKKSSRKIDKKCKDFKINYTLMRVQLLIRNTLLSVLPSVCLPYADPKILELCRC
jgi:hypothetical protein